MKILLLANRDLASNYALNLLLPGLQGHSLKLWLSASVGGAGHRPPALQELQFFEQGLFNELLFPLRDRDNPVPAELQSFVALGRRFGFEPEIENAINAPEALASAAAWGPDLVLSIRYGGILRDAFIAIPPLGVLNLHSGRLPDYRGVMATFWAMLNGDTQLGTTLHFISDGTIDTGAIIDRTVTSLKPQACYLENVLRLYPEGCERMAAAVATLQSGGQLRGDGQEGGRYYSFPGETELSAFYRAGHRLVDPAFLLATAQRFL